MLSIQDETKTNKSSGINKWWTCCRWRHKYTYEFEAEEWQYITDLMHEPGPLFVSNYLHASSAPTLLPFAIDNEERIDFIDTPYYSKFYRGPNRMAMRKLLLHDLVYGKISEKQWLYQMNFVYAELQLHKIEKVQQHHLAK